MQTKFMSVTVGYNQYALSPADAIALLDISTRMREIKQDKYNAPFYFVDDADPLVTMAVIVDVAGQREPKPDPAPIAAPPSDDDVVF